MYNTYIKCLSIKEHGEFNFHPRNFFHAKFNGNGHKCLTATDKHADRLIYGSIGFVTLQD